jgi:glucan phosphoethanolaminetransferase (alkaline phosphatase superfamily)
MVMQKEHHVMTEAGLSVAWTANNEMATVNTSNQALRSASRHLDPYKEQNVRDCPALIIS